MGSTLREDALGKVDYWLKGAAEQNFGDFLSAYLRDRIFLPIGMRAGQYRLIGSTIADFIVKEAPAPADADPLDRRVAFWGCGMRDPTSLTPAWRAQAIICGVRGPLSRDALGLPSNIPMVDPGLLMPALYSPAPSPQTAGRSVAVPHFHDRRDSALLLGLAGADLLMRPNLANDAGAMLAMVDAIAGADFVLSASLHGAIIAAAYGVKFAYWDNGRLDLPFKWDDFAASVAMPSVFAASVAEGRRVHADMIAPALRLPALWPLLAVAPLAVRPEAALAVAAYEGTPDMNAYARLQAGIAAQAGYGTTDDWVLAASRFRPAPHRRWWQFFWR
jgi:hypothetical protein